MRRVGTGVGTELGIALGTGGVQGAADAACGYRVESWWLGTGGSDAGHRAGGADVQG